MKRRGITLLEMIVSFSLFTLIGLTLTLAFVKSAEVWRSVSGSSDSLLNLRKAKARLVPDIKRTSFATVSSIPGLTSLGPIDGDAVWFLSPVDPATGLTLRKSDGTLFWQRNILYYLAVPNDHLATFGVNCTGGADPNGYEENCPHKVLIRKVIDGGTVTDPLDETTEEEILTAAEVMTYLSRPDGFNTSTMNSEPGITDIDLTATFLLSFRGEIAPDSNYQREVRLALAAVKIKSVEREVVLGSTPLLRSRFTRDLTLSLFPGQP